jgi:hypothetical protein
MLSAYTICATSRRRPFAEAFSSPQVKCRSICRTQSSVRRHRVCQRGKVVVVFSILQSLDTTQSRISETIRYGAHHSIAPPSGANRESNVPTQVRSNLVPTGLASVLACCAQIAYTCSKEGHG